MRCRRYLIGLAGSPQRSKFAATLAIFVAACTPAWGADYRWFGGGVTNNWGDSSNWQSALIPPTAQSSGTTTNVLMSGSGGTSDLADVFNNDDDWEIDSLTFESAATGSYDLIGGTLTLANVFSSGTKTIRNSDGNTHSFSNAGIDLRNSAVTFDADTADLDFNTPVNFKLNNITLNVTGGNDVFFDGGIGADGFVTSASMTINGGTTAHIGGTSSALSQITISNGTLQLASNSNLGDAVNITTFSGTTFNVNGFTENIDQITGSGTVSLGSGSLTLGDSSDFTFSGAITGTGSITKNQSGVLTLAGVSSYSGPTNITAGTLRLNNSTTDGSLSSSTDVSVSAGATFDLNGVTDTVNSISGSGTVDLGGGELAVDATAGTEVFSGNFVGTGTLRKLGGHSLTLSGNNEFTSLIISGGTVSASSSSNLGATGATMLLASTLDVNGSFTNARTVFLSNGTIDVGSGSTLTQTGTVQNNAGAASLTKTNAGTLVLSGNNTYTGDTIVNDGRLELASSERIHDTSDLIVNSGVFDLNNVTETVGGLSGASGSIETGGSGGRLIANQSENSTYFGAITGSGGLTKQGVGSLTLSGTNTYTGSTAIQQGTLVLGASGDLSSDTDVTVSSGATFDMNGNSDTVDSISGSGNILLGGAGLSVDQNGGSTVFSGSISESGSLSKTGTHRLTLSGNNSFTGGVAIFDGILSVGADNHLGDPTGAITLAATGTLETTGSFTTARPLQFGMATNGTIDTAAGTTLTHTGSISGGSDVTFRKSGAGTYQLAAANAAYGGNIVIDDGTFEIASFSGDALGNSTRITVNSNGTLLNNQVEGFGSLAGAGNVITNGTLEVGFDNTSTTFSGAVSGNVTGGFFGKAGTGIMTITQPLTYTGPTQINDGTLRLSASGGLPDASDVLVNATWDLNNVSDTVDALSGSGSVLLGGGTLTVGAGNGGATFSGVISEAGSLVKRGSGTQVLSGLNTNTGVTRIEGGRLQIGSSSNLGSGSIQIANGARLQVSGSTTNARSIDLQSGGGTLGVSSGQTLTQSGSLIGVGGLNKADLGTLLLTGSTLYAGTTDVQDGILRLSGSGRIPDASEVVVRSGATWDLNGVSDTVRTINSLGSITLGNATLTVNGSTGNTLFGGVISEPGGLVKAGGHTLQLSGTNTFTGPISLLGGTLSVANNTHLGDVSNSLTMNGGTLRNTSGFNMPRTVSLGAAGGTFDVASTFLTINQPISGTGTLNKTGIGNLSLSASNTYSGGTNIMQGSVAVFTNDGLGANSGAVTLASGTLYATGDFTNFHPLIVSGSGSVSVDGGFTMTHSESITGTGTLTKTGGGVLLLTVPATHAGNTVINQGTLRYGSGGLPDLFDVEVSDPATVWDLNGTSDTIDALIGDGRITLGGAKLTLGAANGGDFFEGVIQGPGALAKIGTGEQVLGGTGTQTATDVNGGALQVGSNNALGAASAPLGFNGGELHTTATFTIPRNVMLNSLGGTFNVDGATTLTMANPITGPGGLTKTGTGTLILQAASNFGGPMSILEGLLQIDTAMTFGGLSGSGNIELGLNELIVNNVGHDTYDGIISGVGGKLTKDGPGTLTLTGINTYTGGTCILDGVLRVSQSENLGALGTLITFDGGTLNTTASFNMIRGMALNAGHGTIDVDAGTQLGASGNVTGVGSLTKLGDGVLSLVGGFSSYEGGTNILAGEVEINNNINLGNTIGQLTLDNGSLHTSGNVAMARLTTLGAGGGAFRTDANTMLTHSGAIVGNPGAAGVAKRGGGDLRWQGNNTFSGNIVLEAGRLQVDASGQLGDVSNTLQMRGGGLLALASFTNPRAIQLETGTGTNTVEVSNGATLTQDGVIADGAMGPPLPLAKTGLGDLLLTASNTYSSPTQIDQGTLRLSGAGRLPDVTDVDVALDSTLDLNGVDDAIDALDGSGDVTLGTGNLTVGADNGDGFFDGVISGDGSLVKVGTGKQIVSTHLGNMGQPIPNTYGGGTQVNGGILNIENDGNLGAATGPLGLDGGELEVQTRGQNGNLNTSRLVNLGPAGGTIDTIAMDNSATMNGVISGPGTLTKLGLGRLTLTAANTYGGDTIIDGGLVRLLGAGQLPNTSRVEVNVASNMTTPQGLDLNDISDAVNGLDGNGEVDLGTATLTVGSAGGNGSFSGKILGAGVVAKTGAGLQALSGNNTYTGGTRFLGGVLEVPFDNSLGTPLGHLTFDGGILRTTGSFATSRLTTLNGGNGSIDTAAGTTLTHNGVISGVGGLTKAGGGTLLLEASNTYTGQTTIEAGIVRLNNVERLANATDVTVAPGGTLDLNNFNESIDALAGAGTVQLGSASLVVGVNNGTGSFSGVVAGTGDLLKEGTGVQTLSGQNTYSGATFIDRGELVLNGGGRIDQSTTVVGFNIGSNGIATLDGAGTTWDLSGNLLIGLDGTARMNIRNGAVMTVEGDVRIGSNNQGAASAGTLSLADGTLDNSAGNGIEIINGTLQGAGTILGDVNNFGQLAPGNSTGILDITGNVVQSNLATLAIEVGGRNNSNPQNPQFDVLNVGGNLGLDGLLDVALLGFTPLQTDTFVVASANQLVGVFSNAASGSRINLSSGGTGSFRVDYGVGSPFGANQIVLSDFQGTGSASGDFNGDGMFDGMDVDSLVVVIAAGTNNPLFDLNGDMLVNTTDLDQWLAIAGAANLPSGNPYLFGDATLDGVVDGQDFIRWNTNKFTSIAAWTAGDFNADGVVDGQDFIRWNTNKFMSSDAGGVSLVPEPASWSICLVAVFAVRRLRGVASCRTIGKRPAD